jgi:ABC-type branched-subunit amino acid transport system substrate-binding protein
VPEWRGIVKVGLVLPFHGGDASAAMATHVAVRDRLLAANARGGISGWRLELVSLDGEGDDAVAARRVAELERDPTVLAVLTTPGSAVAREAGQRGLRAIEVASAAEAANAVDTLLGDAAAASARGRPTRASLARP